jgi:hypothetical protein
MCALLGLATTIGVAWTSAALVLPRYDEFLVRKPPGQSRWVEFGTRTYSGPAAIRVVWGVLHAEGGGDREAALLAGARLALPCSVEADDFPRWGRAPDLQHTGDRYREMRWMRDARGWPIVALWCEWPECRDFRGHEPFGATLGGIDLTDRRATDVFETAARALPYRPIPAGLGVDTGFFAGAWWLVLFGPGWARRAVRRRRGRCEACGYSKKGLGEGAVCPECGRGAA